MPSAKDILDPCAWVWFGLVAVAVWNFRKRAFRPALIAAVMAALLTVSQALHFPERLLAGKERPYWQAADPATQPRAFAGVQAVVMCGGVLSLSARDFTGANYSDAVDRFLKAVEVARLLHTPLVLGGGFSGGEGTPLESVFERRWLQSWGQTNLTVLELGLCYTTHDEALSAARLAHRYGWKKIALVTSAYHMDRALGVFRRAGLQVEPVGCDFRGLPELQNKTNWKFLPSIGSAETLRLYLTESVGLIYYRIRGWI
jgi:uncharacterized SAM-binding protein YcdF (DUF218 family)